MGNRVPSAVPRSQLSFPLQTPPARKHNSPSDRIQYPKRSPSGPKQIEVISREVVGSERVVVPAIFEGEKVYRALLEPVGALKEHVLQEVRLPGLPEFLVPGADAIPDHRGDNRGRMKFAGENGETVVEHRSADNIP